MIQRVSVGRATIEYQVWGEGPPRIVMLHDGLGSVTQWRGTPSAIAERTGGAVLAYDRPGHGRSTPVPIGPWPTRWLHHEAVLLAQLLDRLGITRPLLVGHSDGGSIALLFAAGEPDPSGPSDPQPPQPRCRGLVALAAHTFVEPICIEAISAMRAQPAPTIMGLGAFHANPEAVFEAWSGVWVSDDFSRWDVRHRLSAIEQPTWIVQGSDDSYGTEAQLWTTAGAIGSNATPILLPGLGHLLHHEDSATVVDIVANAYRATETG